MLKSSKREHQKKWCILVSLCLVLCAATAVIHGDAPNAEDQDDMDDIRSMKGLKKLAFQFRKGLNKLMRKSRSSLARRVIDSTAERSNANDAANHNVAALVVSVIKVDPKPQNTQRVNVCVRAVVHYRDPSRHIFKQREDFYVIPVNADETLRQQPGPSNSRPRANANVGQFQEISLEEPAPPAAHSADFIHAINAEQLFSVKGTTENDWPAQKHVDLKGKLPRFYATYDYVVGPERLKVKDGLEEGANNAPDASSKDFCKGAKWSDRPIAFRVKRAKVKRNNRSEEVL